jgi:Rrf2 family protein
MFRLSKKTEYAILAMQYLASRKSSLVSAKEISAALDISFEFLSKSLQALMKAGLVKSQQGIRGGYYLTRNPEDITLMNVTDALNEKTSVVECQEGEEDCDRVEYCTLRSPMNVIQMKIDGIFKQMTISDLLKESMLPPKINGTPKTKLYEISTELK